MVKGPHAKLISSRVWDAALLVKDIDKAVKRLETLGLGQPIHSGPPAGAEGLFYRCRPFVSPFKAFVIQIGNMHLELIQPDDAPNPWIEFLRAKGEGIHHLGFQVDDVAKEVERLVSLGAEMQFYGNINGKTGAAYVDLKLANLIIELTSFCGVDQNSSVKPKLWDMAILVKDLDKTVNRLETLGLSLPIHSGPPAGAEGLYFQGKPLRSDSRMFLTRIGNMQLEFIQPDDSPNPWKEYLKTRGEGIHHLGFQVDDVEKEVDRLVNLGAEVPFYGKINGKIGAAYVDLKIANLFIELTSFCVKT
jgi:catechol 2,3-dioxygenase-like lactoylglutathione lyase family enzyme